MSQMSSTGIQYAGRQIDLLMLDDAQPSGDTLLTQALVKPGQSGAVITGVEKLVQRFLLEFLTERGSLTYLPERGTEFMTSFKFGGLRTSQDVFGAFSSAELSLKNSLVLEESESDPLDERYGSSQLLNVTLGADTISLQIRVTSLAGTDRVVIYPLRSFAFEV